MIFIQLKDGQFRIMSYADELSTSRKLIIFSIYLVQVSLVIGKERNPRG